MMHTTPTGNQPAAAMLANVSRTMEAAMRISERAAHLPGLAVAYGPSGFGKSVAATVTMLQQNAVYVECRSSWTKRDLVEAIAIELGITPLKRVSKTVEAVGEELARSRRLVIIDEADILVDKGHIEMVREIHMTSDAPIMLIGEEALPAKLRRYERIHNRILEWVPFARASLEDARALASIYGRGVTFADDLLDRIVRECAGRVRRIVVNMDGIRSAAIREGADVATLDWWGDRPLYTGEAPSREGGRV